MNTKLRTFLRGISYEIELIMQLVVVITAGTIYGIIEAKYIATNTLTLNVMGHFSYYHVGLLSLMAITSFALALSNIKQLLLNRKKYVLLMCLGSTPLALMIEDVVWFIVERQPIARNEWTMVAPGWGVNLGFTWVPLWYIIVTVFSVTMFWVAARMAKKSHKDRRVRKGRAPR